MTLKKTVLTAVFAVLLSAALFGCGEKEEAKEYYGIPDHTVSRSSVSEPSLTSPESSPAPVTNQAASDTQQVAIDTAPSVTQNTQPEEKPSTKPTGSSAAKKPASSEPKNEDKPASTDEEPEDNVYIEDADPQEETDEPAVQENTRAMDCLKLLNSSKVHAVLTEAECIDTVEISSVEREYFVDGDNAVYINGHQKIIMTSDSVTVIDTEESTYYSYPRGDEDGGDFGYSPSAYKLQSVEADDDGNVTEVYIISSGRNTLKSTWTFAENGKVTVMDESVEYGSFRWYRFDLISRDVSDMDMTVPEGLELISPDDMLMG